MKRYTKSLIALIGMSFLGIASAAPLHITTTVNMVGDLARTIGGNRVQVTELMGAGVDPHLYKASARDVSRLRNADLILYSGLHLEGKMVELLEKNKKAVAVTSDIPKEKLLWPEGGFDGVTGLPDPHFWFDVSLWKIAAQTTRDALTKADPAGKNYYAQNTTRYLKELDSLDGEIKKLIGSIPEKQRVLVTAHDAFNYFSRRYGIEVRGVQGVSTAAEAGTRDIQELSRFLVDRKIPAIFVESSVPKRTIEAVIAAARAQGLTVKIGGELYSDALGNKGTPEGNYIGMFRHNARTITQALLGK